MNKSYDAIIVGSGMGSLTVAALLSTQNLKVLILEQNYLPGGCTSSYWRKGFVFESGATTLVGLDHNMPLQYLLDALNIKIDPIHLRLPMKVYLKDRRVIHRYENIDEWIGEAENIFGKKNQHQFWNFCYKISQFVWETSIKQRFFPPKTFNDLLQCVLNSNPKQLKNIPWAFYSMKSLLKKYGLLENQDFVDFVNEQLLITAQNTIEQVNVLFGATSLCYTNYPNYYMPGGLINMVNPIVDFIQRQQGALHLREEVVSVQKIAGRYHIKTNKDEYESQFFVSGIPLNNTLDIYNDSSTNYLKGKQLKSVHLNSAFQMGIAFKSDAALDGCIHHQIHLKEKLPYIDSKSVFVSLSHPDDPSRSDLPGYTVASVSTHISNPEKNLIENKKEIEDAIIQTLEDYNILNKDSIVYQHSSSQKAWEKWTGRAWGFVGGYPQLISIKPWQMVESRLDHDKAYLVGDTTYPGQGIPGTVLSGIIAYEKLKKDWL